MRWDTTKRPQPGTEDQPSPARLVAEALFAPAPAPVDRSTPQVIVKRRRTLDVDRPVTAPDSHNGDQREERAPKTHLLAVPARHKTPGLDAPPQADEPSRQAAQPPRRRRMRPELNGAVTIIRPQRDEGDIPTDAAQRSPDLSAVPQTQPGSDHWLPALHYPRLLNQIRALEDEAVNLRQREEAVRWITQAIRLYDLTQADIGL